MGYRRARTVESEKAKTFRVARFLLQQLPGQNAKITSIFKFTTNTRKKCIYKKNFLHLSTLLITLIEDTLSWKSINLWIILIKFL